MTPASRTCPTEPLPAGATSRRVDAHHHLWQYEPGLGGWLEEPDAAPIRRSYEMPQLRELTRACDVSSTVLVQSQHRRVETLAMLAAAQDSEGLVAGVVGWVDLRAATVTQDLAELRAAKGGEHLVGIRHSAQAEPAGWLTDRAVRRGVAAVAAAGLAFDLLVQPAQWGDALALAQSQPGVRLVIDHAGQPALAGGDLGPWRQWLLAMARQPQVSVKLSGLATLAGQPWTVADLRPVADAVLSTFGADRVMAGSDWPVCELVTTYQGMWEMLTGLLADSCPDERAAVEGGTAAATYRLAPGPVLTPRR